MNTITTSITRLARPVLAKAPAPRTFTTLTPLRPTLISSFRPQLSFTPTTTTTGTADLVPKTSITAHPALALQIRCGPRNTMNGHSRLIQKRRHGWLARRRSRTGRKILLRREVKGRKKIAQ